MPKITQKILKEIAEKFDINLDIVSLKTLKKGIEVELEHGYVDEKTNVTNDNILLTAKIALAHLEEFPDYYEYLEKMEEKLKKKWKGKKKPSIWL